MICHRCGRVDGGHSEACLAETTKRVAATVLKRREYQRRSYRNLTPEKKAAYLKKCKAYQLAHPAQMKATARAYRQRHPLTGAGRDAQRAKAAKYRAEHHEHTLNIALKSGRKKLPVPTRPCPSVCELCGRSPNRRVLQLDHDHQTHAFRGWLCDRCNLALGKFGDNLAGLQRAVLYLRRNSLDAHGLPHDPDERKQYPLGTGLFDYFGRALCAVAHVSYIGNQQHNPAQPLRWDRSKSTDEADALQRHYLARGTLDQDGLRHSAKMAWRSLALLEKELEAEEAATAETTR